MVRSVMQQWEHLDTLTGSGIKVLHDILGAKSLVEGHNRDLPEQFQVDS